MPKSCINSPVPGERYLNPAGNSPSPLPRLRSDSWHKKQRKIEESSWMSGNIVMCPSEIHGCNENGVIELLIPKALPSRSHPTYEVESGAQAMPSTCEQPDIVVQAENWDVSRELGLTISRMSSDSGCISSTSFSIVATRENPAAVVIQEMKATGVVWFQIPCSINLNHLIRLESILSCLVSLISSPHHNIWILLLLAPINKTTIRGGGVESSLVIAARRMMTRATTGIVTVTM
jgi:hypothetical protein